MAATFIPILIIALLCSGHSLAHDNELHSDRCSPHYVEKLVLNWAPLVWLAPGEKFFPSAVSDFLAHVTPRQGNTSSTHLPGGSLSQHWFLVTKMDIDDLLRNKSSIFYGCNPQRSPVPVYASVTNCRSCNFHVTYWLFYPYNEGKRICTLSAGPLGPWPIPLVNDRCLGTFREFGSHVGDWEHISLHFKGEDNPAAMYVSAHDAGAYYSFDAAFQRFVYTTQEVRRGIMQGPNFPASVQLSPNSSHPILFAAKGSHGLWTAPGKHKYVRLPRLYDVSGYGVRWETWQALEILEEKGLEWLMYWGRWGNPRDKCHPLARLGLNICQHTDGPIGIPLKKHNFHCLT